MRRGGQIGIIVLILIFFVLIANAIVEVALLELRVSISRDRILNYELSSQVLKARFRQLVARQEGRSGFREELDRNVIESTIMNGQDPKAFEVTMVQRLGLWTVNAVRLITWQPLMQLAQDQETLILMRYAFYMERNRRYSIASEKYTDLEDQTSGDSLGFVLLHNAYCLAITGETEKALDRLYRVRDEFPGTHYAETAIVLINLLLEGERRAEEIENLELSDIEKARRLYRAGQYRSALTAFDLIGDLSDMDRFRRGHSMEETGNIEGARDVYIDIIRNGTDRQAKIEANRRLALIARFYGGGEQLADFARENAEGLGDAEAMEEIDTAAEEQEDAVIVQQIREAAEERGEESALLGELGDELVATVELDEPLGSERSRLPRPSVAAGGTNPATLPPGAYNEEELGIIREELDRGPFDLALLDPGRAPVPALYPDGRIIVRLSDGRALRARAVRFEPGVLSLEGGPVPTRVPYAVVRMIEPDTATFPRAIDESPVLFIAKESEETRPIDRIRFDDDRLLIEAEGSEQSIPISEADRLMIP